MLRILVFGLGISLFGCSNVVDNAHVELNKEQQIVAKTQICNFNLEEKLRSFYSPIPDEFRDDIRDNEILEEIKNCPREEIVNSLENLKKSKKNDIEIQAKTAYFLVKLNYNRIENGKLLISTYSAKVKEILKRDKDKDYAQKVERGEIVRDFDNFYLMDLICGFISEENDKQEFLSDAFDLVLLSDGAMSETLSGTLGNQFEQTPELFLQKLKPKSNKIKQQVYRFLFYSKPDDKVLQHLARIEKPSEVYLLVEEILEFAKTRKTEN